MLGEPYKAIPYLRTCVNSKSVSRCVKLSLFVIILYVGFIGYLADSFAYSLSLSLFLLPFLLLLLSFLLPR